MRLIENELLDIGNGNYHSGPGLSSTGLKKILKAPSFFNVPIPDTPAMMIGRATHTAILEPEKYLKKYAIAPKCDKRTKAGKAIWAEFQAENEGKEILKENDAERINEMGLKVFDHPAAAKLLTGGLAEKSLFMTDPTTDILLKIRPDYILNPISSQKHTIIDLKTCRDASPHGFSKAVYNLGYHISAAMYCWVYASVFGERPDFRWVAVENEPPFNVGVYTPDSTMMDTGMDKVREGIQAYKWCQDNQMWPGYSDQIVEIELPGWAQK